MKKITKIDELPQMQPSNTKLRVAAYARVSTDSDEQLESLKAQREHYERYIKSNPEWVFAGLYYDEGISGTKMEKRTELLRMIRDCKQGRIDFIITKSISRFARNTVDCLELVRKLIDIGVYIYFEKENLNTGDMESELMLSILSGFAAEESASISQNSTWSIQKRFQNGSYVGTTPYGYSKADGKMFIVSDEAEIIKRIFSEFLSGKGSSTIARGLNKDKIPASRGNHWSAGTVIDMLRNEKYMGDVLLQKTYTDSNYNRHPNTGEKDQYYYKDNHEAIISREDFAKAQDLIDERAKMKCKGVKKNVYLNRYALSGKMVCGECGRNFRRKTNYSVGRSYIAWNNRGKRSVVWRCVTRVENGPSACDAATVQETELQEAVVKAINYALGDKKKMLETLQANIKSVLKEEESRSMENFDARLRELQQELLQRANSKKDYDDLANEIERLREEKQKANVDKAEREGIKMRIADMKDFLDSQKHEIEEYDEQLVRKMIERIIVYENRFAVEFKSGTSIDVERDHRKNFIAP